MNEFYLRCRKERGRKTAIPRELEFKESPHAGEGVELPAPLVSALLFPVNAKRQKRQKGQKALGVEQDKTRRRPAGAVGLVLLDRVFIGVRLCKCLGCLL